MKKMVWLFVFYACAICSTYGQVLSNLIIEKTIDSLLLSAFKQNEPGCVVLIAKDGQPFYKKAFGSANLELNVDMQPDMVFRVGSVTKQFTAIAILQLMEKKQLLLSDSVQKYIRDFPAKGYTITIEHLLTHTSGLRDYSSIDHPDPFIQRRDFTPQFIIDHFKHHPLEFQPGTKFNYSNSNYALLGYIIEKVTGKSYHSYMKDNILEPLELSNTYFENENTIVLKRVTGYTRDRGFYENCDYQTISLGYACGDLMSTVEDLLKWNNALAAYKIIKKETLQKAFRPYKLTDGSFTNYGYGWFIDTYLGSKIIYHAGQVSGFIAQQKFFPDENIYAVILTNVKSGEDTTDFSDKRFKLFDDVFSLSLGRPLPKQIAISDELLDTYVGTYQPESFIGKDGLKEKITKKALTNEKIIIFKKDDQLYCSLSNGSGMNMVLLAQTENHFILPDVKRIHTTIKFIVQNGKPIGLQWTQEKLLECKKLD
jgi:CubicO group peptidase (beta-lactamase class C family)